MSFYLFFVDENLNTFPKRVSPLAPEKSMKFVHIHSVSQVNVSVLGYNSGNRKDP